MLCRAGRALGTGLNRISSDAQLRVGAAVKSRQVGAAGASESIAPAAPGIRRRVAAQRGR